MATNRKLVFTQDNYYHVFNRGIERRITFYAKKEFERAKSLLNFYQFASIPTRYSQFINLPIEKQNSNMELMIASGKIISIVAYCLMPNHFHFLLRQKEEKGIVTFVSNFTNAYTKYFNIKNDRVGPLFQGVFKAVYVETDEQLLHLTRYIHINPVVSNIVEENKLGDYKWSSYAEYISQKKDSLIADQEKEDILKQVPDYENFANEQIPYAKKLEQVKHLTID